MILNGKQYQFGACPKCSRRRPLHPESGLCWDCGGHCLDPRPASLGKTLTAEERAMSAVDPDLKEILNDLHRRLQLETDPKELLRLILLGEQLSEKI